MMAAVQNLSIRLKYPDNQEGSSPGDRQIRFYNPGDFMEGVVILVLNTSFGVRGLTLNILGHAFTSWENPAKKKTYEDEETCLDHVEPMMDEGKTLHQGCHRFAFRFQLPQNIPSTFHGAYGNVTYTAQAILEADNEVLNTVAKQPFMVLRRDLLPLHVYNPVELSKSKKYVKMEIGKIKASVYLEDSLAVPGEMIGVDAEVCNWSDKDITLLEASVIQEATYYAMKKKIIFRHYLSTHQDFFDVNMKWGRKWTDVKIQVPAHLPDSGLEACNIMDVKYIFQFRVNIRGQNAIVLETPLYIGYRQDDEIPPMFMISRMFTNRTHQPMLHLRPC